MHLNKQAEITLSSDFSFHSGKAHVLRLAQCRDCLMIYSIPIPDPLKILKA